MFGSDLKQIKGIPKFIFTIFHRIDSFGGVVLCAIVIATGASFD
jgi:hypothetical protein